LLESEISGYTYPDIGIPNNLKFSPDISILKLVSQASLSKYMKSENKHNITNMAEIQSLLKIFTYI